MTLSRSFIAVSAVAMTISAISIATMSSAHARPNTVRMSCGAVQELVERAGAIVMSTGGHTFDRFVSNRSYCTPQERTGPAYVATRNGLCFAGYTCEPVLDMEQDQF